MNFRSVLFVLGNLLLVMSLCLVAPFIVGLVYDSGTSTETAENFAFVVTIGVCLVLGGILRFTTAKEQTEIRLREGFAIVSSSWIAMSLVGMLPYLLCDIEISITDAFFETMSGFTTTGATVFPKVEVLPHGVQFWRCMTQWLGGMGIVVLSVALLPFLGAGGYHLLRAETPGGVAFERERPRITDNAQLMWKLYFGLTLTLIAILWLAGMTVFDACCHAFTTMSTGGFSSHSESIAYFMSPVIQWTIVIFMFMAGMNFSLHGHAFRRNLAAVYENREFRAYGLLTVGAIVTFALIVPTTTDLEEHLRRIAFQVVSIGTTTGYATADFNAWPQSVRLGMVLIMFVGGCMGSTSGGMKVARWLIYGKALAREFHRLLFPHAVSRVRVGSRIIEPDLIFNLFGFGLLWTLCFVSGGMVMAAYGYDLPTSMSASIAALGNIGPGLGQVGPTTHWGHLPDGAKWFMSFLMLTGRLELYSVLVLFTPWLWRR